MAVSSEYLGKIRLAVRQSPDDIIDQEITDQIEECRRDLALLGIAKAKVTDEQDPYVLGAVRSFVRWKFGRENADAEKNRDDYMVQRDEMRKRRDYVLE